MNDAPRRLSSIPLDVSNPANILSPEQLAARQRDLDALAERRRRGITEGRVQAYSLIENVPTNDGRSWGYRCWICGLGSDGYIKRQYADEEARTHVAEHDA